MIYGIGGEQDIARGIEGYELFLQFDPQDARVLTLLGKAKQYGWAGERDIPAAIAFYERAIEGGSTSAMWELGMLLKDGDGVEADAKKAWDLIVRASDAGDENAMISRAVLLALGEGVPQNYGQAYAWYEKAASNGRAHAIRSLAFMNQQGQDREVDPQLAWGLYTLAEPFDEIAKIRLAEMQAKNFWQKRKLKPKHGWLRIIYPAKIYANLVRSYYLAHAKTYLINYVFVLIHYL
jgi:TPR repeat protein